MSDSGVGRLMLICQIDEAMGLHLLERRHVPAVASLDAGDLTFSQGEWLFSKGGATDWVNATLIEFSRGNGVDGGIFRAGTLLGVVSLHGICTRRASAHIDYAMDARYRNQGIMTKACRALVTYAFDEPGLNRIEIGADVANLPSLRIPEKLGFAKEGVRRAFYRAETGFRDCSLHAMLARDWVRSSAA